MKKLLTFLIIPFLSFGQQLITENMVFDGQEREYMLYIPASYDATSEFPLLFNFHGGSGYAEDFIYTNDMRPIADTANFIAIYPQGAVDPDGGTTSWIHKAPTDHDDIFFIEAIINSLNENYLIDQSRIYTCGYSEGAIFSYELGCRLNDKIAAFVAVSGSMLSDYYRNDIYEWGPCAPIHPTAMMLIPGTNDDNPHSSYDGFTYYDLPLYLSVDEITSYWSGYNDTDINPILSELPNINTSDGSSVERYSWFNGDGCVAVEELRIINGGHDWPGSFGNMDINASLEIWKFVSKYNTNGLINCNLSSSPESSIIYKNLITTIDVLGRKINTHQGFQLNIYDDGSVEKKYLIK